MTRQMKEDIERIYWVLVAYCENLATDQEAKEIDAAWKRVKGGVK